MKIKFQTNKVLDFIKLSEYIQTVNLDLAPIQRYIRVEIVFGTCTMTKSNNNQYAINIFDVECDEDIEILLLEEELAGFAKLAQNDYFEVDYNEQNGYVDCTDGYYTYSFSNGIIDKNLFQVIPDIKKENPVVLDRSVITFLNIAKSFIGKDDLTPQFQSVYLNENYMYATDGHIMYIRELPNKYPFIAFSGKECDLIKDFEYVEFIQSSSYNNFICKNTTYGFINKTNSNGFDFMQFLKTVKKQSYVKIRTLDFINFCNAAIVASKSKDKSVYISSKFVLEGNKINFSYENSEYNKRTKLPVDAETFDINYFDFLFFAPTVLSVLKTYPYKDIYISDINNSAFSVWSKEDQAFVCIIRKQSQ